jgi:Uncharacterised nucleotidyltransferase
MDRSLSSAVGPSAPESGQTSIWHGVGRLADRAATLDDLRLHRIHLVVARHWRSEGRPVPSELAEEEHASMMVGLAATHLLQRVRAGYDGRIVLMKGLEVGAHYPDSSLRPFRDLDLLVDDAALAQQELIDAGFEPTGDERLYVNIHHLRPLRWPGLPLVVEIHDRPKWLDWQTPPPTAELLNAAVPSRVGVDGVETLPPAYHVLVLAVHSWAHDPLSRIGHLLDVAALAESASRADVDALATAWGVERVWRATAAAAAGLFQRGKVPTKMRSWAGHLESVRERTVVESHLERWLSPFWGRRPRPALEASLAAIRTGFVPEEGESWRVKGARVAQGLRTPFRRLSKHRAALEEKSISGPSFLDRQDDD